MRPPPPGTSSGTTTRSACHWRTSIGSASGRRSSSCRTSAPSGARWRVATAARCGTNGAARATGFRPASACSCLRVFTALMVFRLSAGRPERRGAAAHRPRVRGHQEGVQRPQICPRRAIQGGAFRTVVRVAVHEHAWRERCGHRSLRTVLLLQEHWSSVFKKLSMAKGLALDSVNVGHFLEAQVLEAVAMHTTWLKDLHSRCVRTDAWRFTRWRAASCLHSFDLPC